MEPLWAETKAVHWAELKDAQKARQKAVHSVAYLVERWVEKMGVLLAG